MATHSSISCLENSMDRGAWWATVHGVAESQTQLSKQQRSGKLGEQNIDLSIFFLTTACESTLSKISAAIHIKKKKKKENKAKLSKLGIEGNFLRMIKSTLVLPSSWYLGFFFFFSHSHWYVVVSHCNLQFPNDK